MDVIKADKKFKFWVTEQDKLKDHFISYSSGIESITMLYTLLKIGIPENRIHLIFYKYKLDDTTAFELQQVEKISKIFNFGGVHILDLHLPGLDYSNEVNGMKSAKTSSNYFRLRNTFMIANTAAYIEMESEKDLNPNGYCLHLGANLSESMTYPDNNQNYIDGMKKVISNSTRNIGLINMEAMFQHLTKYEIIELAHKIGVDFDLSTSCYKPYKNQDNEYVECKECGSCILKYSALEKYKLRNDFRSNH